MTEFNTLQGVFIITCTVLLYTIALYLCHKNKLLASLAIIVCTGFVLRLFVASDPLLHQWDERYHALVAKNMISEPFVPTLYKDPLLEYDYKDWGSNHVWLHKQPFPLWSMATSMKIFGVNTFSLRLPSILLSTLFIFCTFLIGRFLFDDFVGVVAAFFCSVNGLIIELTGGRVTTDHIDIFFMVFIQLAILFALWDKSRLKKFQPLLVGIFTGIAILCKWLPALITVLIYFTYNAKRTNIKKNLFDFCTIIITAGFIALPWQIYAATNFPLEYYWENIYNLRHATEGLEGHGRPWYFHLDRARIIVNELIYVVFIWFCYQFNHTKKEDWVLLVWVVVPYLFFSFAKTKMQGYVLLTFPALFIILALFYQNLNNRIKTEKKTYVRILIKIVMVSLLLLAFRYGMERIKPFEDQSIQKRAKQELSNLQLSKNDCIFNVPCPIEVMFYTNCVAYSYMPGKEVLADLERSGYTLYTVKEGYIYALNANGMQGKKYDVKYLKRVCSE